MVQEQIYKKDINRVIDGVIKADSTAKLAEEITEFVITGEQIRHHQAVRQLDGGLLHGTLLCR